MVSNKFILSFIVLLIIIPLALATTIEPAKSNGRYDLGDSVSFKGTCVKAGNTVAIETGIGLNRVWVGEETANANKVFQTTNFVPPQKGTYSVTAACDTESSATSSFCVGSSAECGITVTTTSSTGSSTGGSSGGGGGGGCIPKWETGYSLCNSSLQRTKTSVDVSKCNRNTRVDVESCPVCEESWVCRGSTGAPWGACVNGQQTRTCADEHQCGTITTKPSLTRSCKGEKSTFIPPTLPPSRPPAFDNFEPVDSGNGDTYIAWLIGGVASLLILIIVILITFIMSKHHHVIYNHNELVEWIQKERSMGTADQDIKEILADNTGWTHEELEDAFSMLALGQPQQSQQVLQAEQ